LDADEVTIAEALKNVGYSTACTGKWHLGDQADDLPRTQGFDYYYSIPYSNDMNPTILMQNETTIPG
jgi:arylsulfatase A